MNGRNTGNGGRWRHFAIVAMLIIGTAGLTPSARAEAGRDALRRGQALLASGQPDEAKQAFEAALAANPDSVEAHLGLARSYYALGEYALAIDAFEAVLRHDGLPRDLHSQAETYDQMAVEYSADGWATSFSAETGVGVYRQNSSKSTDIDGGAGDRDTYLPIRLTGDWSTSLSEHQAFNAALDYRFRRYDNPGRRNDSDLRWNVNLNRPLDDDSLRMGMRGRVSYRGEGRYRNDWGVFADYDFGIGPNDSVTVGGEYRERRYPRGPLRDRTSTIAEVGVDWSHSLANGRTSFALGGSAGRERATQGRIDGDAAIWGITAEFDHSISDTLDLFLWGEYANEGFRDERPDVPSGTDLSLGRQDDLWYFGGGLVWRFAPGWSLRPTIEYDWEDSNIPALAYSKTDVTLTVRRSF
jgi:tetratricopeptide (TPR) repeat protein